MSRKVTFLIVVLAVLILAGGTITAILNQSLVRNPGEATTGDPAEIDKIAKTLLKFTPPPGYTPNYGVDTTTLMLAGYGADAPHNNLVLMQIPDWATMTDEAITAQGWAQLEAEYQVRRGDAAVVEQRTVTTAAGKEQAYTIVEGTDDGAAYRGLYALVLNPYGLVFLYYEVPADAWNDATADALVASIET